MNTNLISITAPVNEKFANFTGDQLIAAIARVSNPSNQVNTVTMPKLLAYCIKNKHWSIFEMVDMTVEIQTSRAIAAQILRHKSFSFQELSQRYAKVSALEPIEYRKQGLTNRQVGDGSIQLDTETQRKIDDLQNNAMSLYDDLVQQGVAKECARFILPLNTQTTLYMKGSVRSWIHYFDVRCDQHTQKEHRDIALSIRNIFSQHFPLISEALSYPKT